VKPPARHIITPRRNRKVAVTLAAGTATIGSFLRWEQRGGRNSFELFSVVDRLDLLDSVWFSALASVWPLTPFVALCSIVSAHTTTATWANLAAVSAGLYVAGVAGAAQLAPGVSGAGPAVTCLAGLAWAASSAMPAR
jgi:hypothetical protein